MKRNYQLKGVFLFAAWVALLWSTAAQAQLPTVTAVSPMVGYPASFVVITGTNFNTTPANNIVYFGATRATVSVASDTSLTVTVPIGATYMPVSVNNTASSLTGYSQYPFLPAFDNSVQKSDTVVMNSKTDFPANNAPFSVAIGDLDGDGKADLAVANSGSNSVSVYHNTSSSGAITSGSFAGKVDFITGSSPMSVAIGDLDGDGKPDIAVANNGSNSISVFRNTSSSGTITSGSFAARIDFVTGNNPRGLAIGDLDGDGMADLAVTNDAAHSVSVLRNTSTSGTITSGSFAGKVDFNTGSFPHSVAIGDLDGDGKPDLAVPNTSSQSVSVLRNTSSSGSITSGSFADKVDFATTGAPRCVALGDLDGDGKSEMVVADYTANRLYVYRNISSRGVLTLGSFALRVTFTTGTNPHTVAIGDLNGDGKADLAVTNYNSATVTVYRNTSTSGAITSSSFAGKVDFATGASPYGVAIGDLDGDGKADLAVANAGSNTVSVFRNSPIWLPPMVTTVSPMIGYPASSVTITGTHFNTTPANNIVYFGATQATVTTANDTSLTVTVPVGATYMPVSVNNTASHLTGYSQYPFLPSFDNSAYVPDTVVMNSRVNFATSASPCDVAIGDLDGDGKADMVVTYQDYNTNRVSVFRNTSSNGAITPGSFADKVDFATVGNAFSVAIGDMDGDGRPDLVVGAGKVSIFRNTGSSGAITSSSFANRVDFDITYAAYHIAIGDLDGDGKPELVGVTGDNFISVLHNRSSIGDLNVNSFAPKVRINMSKVAWQVVIADVDGDGKADLAALDQEHNTVSVLRNTSSRGTITSGSFAANVDFPVGSSVASLAIGDLDGDGKPDLVVTNYTPNTVSVLHNTSSSGVLNSSSFAGRVAFSTGVYANRVVIGDLDGDGKADVVVANRGGKVSVLRNTSTSGAITSASFARRVDFTTGIYATGIAIGDLDGDGIADMAVTNLGDSTVSVYRNNPLPATPDVSNFTATTATDVCKGNASVVTINAATLVTGKSYKVNYTTGGANVGGPHTSAVFVYGAGSGSFVIDAVNIPNAGATTVTVNYVTDSVTSLNSVTPAANNIAGFAVNETPSVAVTPVAAICQGGATAQLNGSFGGSATLAIWDDGAVGGTFANNTGGTPGTTTYTSSASAITPVTLKLTTSGGLCGTVADSVSLVVNPLPAVTSIGSNSPVCANTQLELTSATSGGTASYSLSWSGPGSFADTGSNTALPAATTAATGTYTIVVTDANGCKDTAATAVIVNAVPVIDSTGNSGPVCAGAPLSLSSAASGGSGLVSYSWSGPGSFSSADQDPAIAAALLNAAGTYTLVVTDDNSCADTAITVAVVNELPAAIADYSGPVCAGIPLDLIGGVTGGGGPYSFSWSGPNSFSAMGTNTSVPFTTTAATGVYTLIVTDDYGCADTATIAATVYPALVISVDNNAPVCEGISLSLSSTVTGGTPAFNYAWSGPKSFHAITPDPLVAAAATVAEDGAYQLIVTDENNCADTATTPVTVYPLQPIVGETTVLFGQTITLSDPVPGGSWSTLMPWTTKVFPATGAVKGISAGIAEVSYTTPHGCVATYSITVLAGLNVCVGQTITISDGGTGGTWTSSSAGIAKVGAATGVITGVATGRVVITHRLLTGAIITNTVTVNPLAVITSSSSGVCQGQSLALTNATIGGGTWYSGNTATAAISATGIVSGLTGGSVTIYFTPQAGCVTSKVISITPVVPITGSMSVCVGQTVSLSNSMAGGVWSSSSGSLASVSATGVVKGIHVGNPRISYIWPTGCQSITTFTVNALSAITGGTMGMCQGGTMTLANATPFGGVWSSSNTAAATVSATGVVRGAGVGTAVISFTTNLAGCIATRSLNINACREAGDDDVVLIEQATQVVSSVQLFPNPNKGIFRLKGAVGLQQGAIQVTIVNILGQVIYSKGIEVFNGNIDEQISLSNNIATGMYLLNLQGVRITKIFHFAIAE